MISASFYSCYPIIAYYKGLFLTYEKLDNLLFTNNFNDFIEQMNGIFSSYFLQKISPNNSINQIEKEIQTNYFHVFKKLKHFFFGDIKNLSYIFNEFFNIKTDLNKISEHNIKSKFLEQLLKEFPNKELFYYESLLYNKYFSKTKQIFMQLNTDGGCFSLLTNFIDFINIKIILNTAYSLNLKEEEIKSILNYSGSNIILNNVPKIIDLDLDEKLKKNPLLKNLKQSKNLENYINLLKNFKSIVSKKIGGNPFRYSFFYAFFINLLIDYEILIIILNFYKLDLDRNILKLILLEHSDV